MGHTLTKESWDSEVAPVGSELLIVIQCVIQGLKNTAASADNALQLLSLLDSTMALL